MITHLLFHVQYIKSHRHAPFVRAITPIYHNFSIHLSFMPCNWYGATAFRFRENLTHISIAKFRYHPYFTHSIRNNFCLIDIFTWFFRIKAVNNMSESMWYAYYHSVWNTSFRRFLPPYTRYLLHCARGIRRCGTFWRQIRRKTLNYWEFFMRNVRLF